MSFYPSHELDNLRWMNAKILMGESFMSSVQSFLIEDSKVWHKRFGHIRNDALNKAKDSCKGFPAKLQIDKKDIICRGCAKGKMTAKSYPISGKRAKEILELVHLDVMEFPTISYNRNKYALTIIDDCSSTGWVYPLKKKSDAFEEFKAWKRMIETATGKKVKRARIDHGGEFWSNESQAWYKAEGLVVEKSAPYIHQQNGRAERFNRTLRETSEALRWQCCAPESWWEFAIITAVHIYNRTPIRTKQWKTPVELFEGKKPDVSYFRTFGCGAYVHLPKDTRPNKLAPKSEAMIFIGYDVGSKAYKFFRPTRQTIYISPHAIFDETWFPKCSKETPGSIEFDKSNKPVGSIPFSSYPFDGHDHNDDQNQPGYFDDDQDDWLVNPNLDNDMGNQPPADQPPAGDRHQGNPQGQNPPALSRFSLFPCFPSHVHTPPSLPITFPHLPSSPSSISFRPFLLTDPCVASIVTVIGPHGAP